MFKRMIFTLLLATLSLYGAPRRVAATKAAEPIRLDGKFEEPAWESTSWQAGFTTPKLGTPAPQETRFKVLAGKRGLYFAFQVEDSSVVANRHEHDYALWNEDCIEIFLTPEAEPSSDPNIREYKQFIFNALGMQFEQFSRGGVGDTSWNAPWKVATHIHDKGFDAEVFIPYYVMEPATNAQTWRFNIAREDPDKEKTAHHLSIWSPAPKFADLDSFGVLENIPVDFAPYQVSLDSPSLAMRVIDDMATPVFVGTLRGIPDKHYSVKVAIRQDGEVLAFQAAEVVVPQEGNVSVTVPLPLKDSGAYECQVLVTEERSGLMVHYQEGRFELNISKVVVRLKGQCYRDSVYLSLPEPKLEFQVECLAAAEELLVQVLDAQGREKEREVFKPAPSVHHFQFAAADYAPGAYKIRATLKGAKANDDVIAVPFQVVPKPTSGNVVVLNPERRVLMNGKPFFPCGFLGGPGPMTTMSQAGFNFVHSYVVHYYDIERILKTLDEAQEAGIYLAFYPTHKISCGFFEFKEKGKMVKTLSPDSFEQMGKMVDAVKGHPALFGWYLYDEPRGAEITAQLKRIYEFLRERDPYHPVLGLDNSAAGCINKKGHCDIHVLDMYPSPNQDNTYSIELEATASAMEKVVNSVGREGAWHCPQAFDRQSFEGGKGFGRAPTFVETRAVVFGALAAGATAIVPYKIGNPELEYFQVNTNSGIFASPEMKVGWLEGLGPELKNLSPVLLAQPIRVASTPARLRVFARKLNGKHFVVAANLEKRPVPVEIQWPTPAKNVRVLGEKRSVPLQDGKIIETFEQYAVHVYTDDPAYPEGVDLAAVAAKIKADLAAAKRP